MKLSRLVAGFQVTPPEADPEISGVTEDSRRVRPGMLFVAVPGTLLDGHAYIAEALSRGAAAIIAERTGAIPLGVPVVRVPSSRDALAVVAARHYGTLDSSLSIVGFTGTFGKTSTSEILRELLNAAGHRTGVVGSLGARYDTFAHPGYGLTTPAPVELHRALRDLQGAGASTVILEVTSHALMLGRVAGLQFAGGLIAAIMPGEHTDFHRSYEDYVEAKRLFLDHLEPDALVAYDADNLAARQLIALRSRSAGAAAEIDAPGSPIGMERHVHQRGHRSHGWMDPGASAAPLSPVGFSLEGRDADLCLYDAVLDGKGATFTVGGPIVGARSGIRIHSPLLGRGNLRNVALALTYVLGTGLPISAAEPVIARLRPLRRRMERFDAAARTILDDTAAHPDSLRATLEVAALLPHKKIAVVYAVRGRRGADINRQNAMALADLASLHGVEPLIVTSASDSVSPADAAQPGEIDAARQALVARGRRFVWHEELRPALVDALGRTNAGDLIVLVGAQGMNEGKEILLTL
jgi:UDP-N-acetylmuramoyl-L-alanyl-D-glutamate--2,6-diaminopimelate ligase